ncbi:MAG: DUF342 domain-containing protein [Planctomycetes bacterium]|nr:DUF342 domain-containing protein [Planctomycetota bacterium]
MSRQPREQALLLQVDPDKLHASLVCVESNTPGCFDNILGAREALQNHNIKFGINTSLLQETFEKQESMELGSKVVIARSQDPVEPVDGRVEFLVDVSGEAKYSGAQEEFGSVDFRSATSVTCVKQGELLAKIFPPKQGKPGCNICGETIPARQPKEAFIRAGSNVNFDAKEKTFTAVEGGRPVFADGVLSVLPVYEVSGDVDYETGHIKFAGSVVVKGNVLNDFNIEAKEIEVGGTVGACNLTATNNIMIIGGINGNDRAVIKAGGSVTAKYINNCYVECLGNITSPNGILNSKIMCNGMVRSTTLIGGATCARLGVEVKEVGSDMGVATQVELGVDILVRKLENLLEVIDGEIEKLLTPYAILLEDIKQYRAYPDEKKAAIKENFELFKDLKGKHERLAKRRVGLLQNATAEPLKEIVVLGTIYADTIVRTDFCMRNFNQAINGPVRIVEDIASSTMATAPYSQKENKTELAEKA